MFTGIVGEIGTVLSLLPGKLSVGAQTILKGLTLGASVAVNGACLTVTAFDEKTFQVDLAPETERRTNLWQLRRGDPVNLERALGLGAELGGHLVQGHIDGTGKLLAVRPEGNASIFRFNAPPEIQRYLVEKGFIAVDGISLTVSAIGADYFEVSVISFSLRNTVLQYRKAGDTVNLEIDIMAKYAERLMAAQASRISMDFLRQNGF
ncbi:MAG TPA: riboflavin synthase [Dehalococcoidales bacterium]|nr:riboflavin synthase [Dehalococcoidales bacterium]